MEPNILTLTETRIVKDTLWQMIIEQCCPEEKFNTFFLEVWHILKVTYHNKIKEIPKPVPLSLSKDM